MNKVGQILLLVGGLVLALLIGVLIGRGQRVQPTSEGNASAVQITTAAPPSAPPPPLPAPVQPPQAVAVPKPAPDLQVQEDAAAVGMTTREPTDQGGNAASTPAPRSAADTGADVKPTQPKG